MYHLPVEKMYENLCSQAGNLNTACATCRFLRDKLHSSEEWVIFRFMEVLQCKMGFCSVSDVKKIKLKKITEVKLKKYAIETEGWFKSNLAKKRCVM